MARKDRLKTIKKAMSAMERRAMEATGEAPVSKDLMPYSMGGPSIDTDERSIGNLNFDYSILNRTTDFVLGGPLGESMREPSEAGKVVGRWFVDWRDVMTWAKAKYGDRLKGRKPSEPGDTYRWAIIVRKEANVSN